MANPHRYGVAAALPSGKVLVAGGQDSYPVLGAELFDPVARTFSPTKNLEFTLWLGTAVALADGDVLLLGTLATNAERYSPPIEGAPGTFTVTGLMNQGRSGHTATLLPGGEVLVAGAYGGGGGGNGADLYDPATGKYTPTGSLSVARSSHTATLLPSGLVLIAGGDVDQSNGPNLATAELYNPATGTFSATGSMSTLRSGHIATLLPNGLVLMAGGNNSSTGVVNCVASAELFNPSLGTFTPTGSMASARCWGPTATLLPNGLVLVAGDGTAELYNPVTGSFVSAGAMRAFREGHSATLLPDGKVLLAGGTHDPATAELYDPATGSFTATGNMTLPFRANHSAVLTPDGRVIIAGGYVNAATGALTAAAEVYTPATGTFTSTGSLLQARARHASILLPTGSVLVTGGYGPTPEQPLPYGRRTCELYWP
jgi:hypothetical protein